MMSVGLHMRLIGHPARSAGLERFLDYVTKHPDVWVCRRLDIARHWIKEHPPRP
jgi:allantoinase